MRDRVSKLLLTLSLTLLVVAGTSFLPSRFLASRAGIESVAGVRGRASQVSHQFAGSAQDFFGLSPTWLHVGARLPRTATLAGQPAQSSADGGAPPRLMFSDLESGPRKGNSDTSLGQVSGANGAIVTIWGRKLGDSQGDSIVTVNGAQARSVYFWGNAEAPANLFKRHRMQMVSFQVPSQAQEGKGEIYVTVGGQRSNSLPFTVRSGKIYFVQKTGSDSKGKGTWKKPWRTVLKAKNSLAPGDIAYIGDGVSQTGPDSHRAAVNLNSSGGSSRPKALVAYPGARVYVGDQSLRGAFTGWISGRGWSENWVISKLRVAARSQGVVARTGYRIVGNYFTGPSGDGKTGFIPARGSHIRILGNEFENVGAPNSSHLYHVIYLQGKRARSGPRLPPERDREVGWNYFHDNQANRAVNVYSQQASSAFMEEHRIHDNFIENQRGDAILFGYYVTGENWAYNNVVVNVTGAGINIRAGHDEHPNTTIHAYNNTVYGAAAGSVVVKNDIMDRITFRFSNNLLYSTGEPYVHTRALIPRGPYNNLWYGNGPAPLWDSAAINSDPRFVDARNRDFRLQPNSPAIDRGVSHVGSVVTTDFEGVSRPQGSGYDIGAFEFSPAGSWASSGLSTTRYLKVYALECTSLAREFRKIPNHLKATRRPRLQVVE